MKKNLFPKVCAIIMVLLSALGSLALNADLGVILSFDITNNTNYAFSAQMELPNCLYNNYFTGGMNNETGTIFSVLPVSTPDSDGGNSSGSLIVAGDDRPLCWGATSSFSLPYKLSDGNNVYNDILEFTQKAGGPWAVDLGAYATLTSSTTCALNDGNCTDLKITINQPPPKNQMAVKSAESVGQQKMYEAAKPVERKAVRR